MPLTRTRKPSPRLLQRDGRSVQMDCEPPTSFVNIGSAVTWTGAIHSSCMKAIRFIESKAVRVGICGRTTSSSLPRRDVVQTPNVSANDAVVAEVNKQRAATRAFTEQTATLNQKLNSLGEVVGQTQEVAKQNLELKRDVAALREHLDRLDTQLRERKAPASAPSPSPEDKW